MRRKTARTKEEKMANPTDEILKTILEQVKGIARTETILGEPIRFDDLMIIPVSKVAIGFGAGGANKNTDPSGGGGGGVSVEPIAFIVVQKDEVKLLPVKTKVFGSLIEGIPDLVSKLAELKKGKGKCKDEAHDDDDV
jgi:uncharacterized spore protein YtfJ